MHGLLVAPVDAVAAGKPRPRRPRRPAEYLRMRMARAGCTREVFASDAIVLLHEATAGAMRDLDRLAAAGVAATTALSIVIVSVHCSYLAMQESGTSARELLGAHVPGLVLAAMVGVAAWPAAEALRATTAPPALRFAAIAVLGIALALALAGTALWVRGRRDADAGWLHEELGRVRRRFRRR